MSDQPLVLVTRQVPGLVDIPGAQIRLGGPDPMPRAALLDAVRGTSVIISMYHDAINDELLDAAGPTLRGVCNFAVGFDNIDVGACRARKVAVGNTPDAVTEGTANMAIALMLAAARRVVEGDAFVRSGGFAARGQLGMDEFLGMHLTGQTLLIVGAGRIGKATAMRALGFGMRVMYVARTQHVDFELAPLVAQRVELDEGLRLADVVSVHTPLNDQTRHLLNRERIAMLKETAIVVNTARGPIIDEAALADALAEKRIYAAGLDVYEDEPRANPRLLDLPNVVMTPHIGSGEIKYREMMCQRACANARAILAGKPPVYPVL